jgi:hypothetical protein
VIGTSKPILILDFDGVLHPSLATADQYLCRMPLLVEVVTDLDIDLVISLIGDFITNGAPYTVSSAVDSRET